VFAHVHVFLSSGYWTMRPLSLVTWSRNWNPLQSIISDFWCPTAMEKPAAHGSLFLQRKTVSSTTETDTHTHTYNVHKHNRKSLSTQTVCCV